MGVTFYSFLMSYWTMTILILVFFILRYFLRMRYRVRDLLLILVLCLGRTILPIEFHFTKEIPAGPFYNVIFNIWNHKVVHSFSVGKITMLLWLVGTFAFLIRSIYLRYALYKNVLKESTDITDVTYEKYDRIFDNLGRRIRVRIYESDKVSVPYSFGIFKKGIVMPANSKEPETPYFLMHEYGHHLHRDLQIMMIIDIWLAVFWWSPFSYLLRHKMEETLELNCDYLVTRSMSNSEKKNYLQSIVSVLKNVEAERKTCKVSTMGLARFNNKKFVVERFENIAKRKEKQNKLLSIIFYFVVGIIVASSYTFVFQSSFPIEENAENGYVIDTIYYDEENDLYILLAGGKAYPLSEEELEIYKSIGIEMEEKR